MRQLESGAGGACLVARRHVPRCPEACAPSAARRRGVVSARMAPRRSAAGRAGGVILGDLETERLELGPNHVGYFTLIPGRAGCFAEANEAAHPG